MVTLYIVLVSAVFPLSMWGYGEVSRFLRGHPEICSHESLDAFKEMARRNMYGALAYLLLGLPALILGLYLAVSQDMVGKILFLTPIGLLHVIGSRAKAREIEARTLPCVDALAAEYRKIGDAWEKKVFPDF